MRVSLAITKSIKAFLLSFGFQKAFFGCTKKKLAELIAGGLRLRHNNRIYAFTESQLTKLKLILSKAGDVYVLYVTLVRLVRSE